MSVRLTTASAIWEAARSDGRPRAMRNCPSTLVITVNGTVAPSSTERRDARTRSPIPSQAVSIQAGRTIIGSASRTATHVAARIPAVVSVALPGLLAAALELALHRQHDVGSRRRDARGEVEQARRDAVEGDLLRAENGADHDHVCREQHLPGDVAEEGVAREAEQLPHGLPGHETRREPEAGQLAPHVEHRVREPDDGGDQDERREDGQCAMPRQDGEHEHEVDADRDEGAGVEDVEALSTLEKAAKETERRLRREREDRDHACDLGGAPEIGRERDQLGEEPCEHEPDHEGERAEDEKDREARRRERVDVSRVPGAAVKRRVADHGRRDSEVEDAEERRQGCDEDPRAVALLGDGADRDGCQDQPREYRDSVCQVVRADVPRGEPHARIVAEVDDGVGERLRIGIPGV